MMHLENSKEVIWPEEDPAWDERLEQIDLDMASQKSLIQGIMDERLGPLSSARQRVTPKPMHATTVDDIDSLVSFVKFVSPPIHGDSSPYGNREENKRIIRKFLADREFIKGSELQGFYHYFSVPLQNFEAEMKKHKAILDFLSLLVQKVPRSYREFSIIVKHMRDDELVQFIKDEWEAAFSPYAGGVSRFFCKIWSYFSHPVIKKMTGLRKLVLNQFEFLKMVREMPEGARVFRGNYTDFLTARANWMSEAEAAQKRQDKERARIERFIEKFRYKATKASQVQSRIKSLEKMLEVEKPKEQRTVS
ncbi:MAG: hypothetical protein HQK54_13255, partial [Oligoflexales bacterium]|nr:hypothetical protein [Oligoflexales bacterium]